MKITIKGVLQKVDKQTGTTKSGGEWQKYLAWIVVGEKQLMVSFFGDKFEYIQKLKVGTDVEIVAFLETREWQGKGFTDISGSELKTADEINDKVAKATVGNAKLDQQFENIVGKNEDDLPF